MVNDIALRDIFLSYILRVINTIGIKYIAIRQQQVQK